MRATFLLDTETDLDASMKEYTSYSVKNFLDEGYNYSNKWRIQSHELLDACPERTSPGQNVGDATLRSLNPSNFITNTGSFPSGARDRLDHSQTTLPQNTDRVAHTNATNLSCHKRIVFLMSRLDNKPTQPREVTV